MRSTVIAVLSIAAGCGGATSAPAPGETSAEPTADAPGGTSAPGYVPLFAAGTEPVERIQYTDTDGTLVTLAGFRPTNRHAREGGEPWTDTVDQGPGNYLTFPTFYFQNRTYGLVIRDEVPAGRQKITVYLKPNVGTFINNGFSAFRRIDADVIEYGWKMGVGFDNKIENNQRCHASDQLEDLCVAQSITDNWRSVEDGEPNNLLRVGQKIEMSPAQFLDYAPGSDKALIDGGGIRYYSFEQLYVVGKGMVPWYGVAPKLDSSPLPDDALLGGQASVSYDYSEEPHRAFQQTVNNIGIADMQRFVEGRRLFHISYLDGKHSESPDINPVFTEHAGQLGARYNAVRCLGCHTLNGRSPAPAIGAKLNTMAVLTAAGSTTAAIAPDPTYGFNVQELARDAGAADYSVTVGAFETTVRELPDGTRVELQKPIYAFTGPTPAQLSVRQAPQVIGMGLLEAIDETTILALSDPDDRDGDGVHGVPNWSTDPETGELHLGRFGWKAGKGSVRHQAANAFLLDLGVTTPLYKDADCQAGGPACKTSTAAVAISSDELDRVASYLQLLGVPAHRMYRSGYTDGVVMPPEHDVDEALIRQGRALFAQVACTGCHVAELKTGSNHRFAELRDQVIHPYSDLLLHDMGPGLADTLTEGQAGPQMWRTQPLWGLGTLKYVQSQNTGVLEGSADPASVRYLHDGRARTLLEAIAWHDGEAARSRAAFEALSATDRAAVVAFLDSL